MNKKIPKKSFLRDFIIIAVLICVPCLPAFAGSSGLKLHFIDVGEGDAVLAITPCARAVLVDAGNLISGFRVAEYLKSLGIDRLDAVIFSHAHPDHAGGAFFILQEFGADRVFDNGQSLEELSVAQDFYRWYGLLARGHKNYKAINAGYAFAIDGVTFRVLWPSALPVSADLNAGSLVVMVEYGDFRCLLSGDVTRETQSRLASGADLSASVLKLGHHADCDSNPEGFLKAVSPRVAVASIDRADARNRPCPETLKYLDRTGARLYRTDQDSDIIITADKNGDYTVTVKPR